jgi:pilus assembly protein CpaB
MFFRIAIFMMLAMGLAGFGAVAWISTRTPDPVVVANVPVPAPARTSVLIASRPLRAGALIRPEDLGATEVVTASMRADAVLATPDNRTALAGAMLRNSFALGEELRAASMIRPGDRGFLAAVLTPGTRAVSVAVDAVLGVGGLIWPGDHVDMLLTQAIEDTGVSAGRRFAGETVLSDLRIVAVDRTIIQGAVSDVTESAQNSSNTARTVTVEVTPQQAERIAVAGRMGRISLSVRAASGLDGDGVVRPVTWAKDISSALGGGASGGTVNVFAGPADKKEFKF